MAASLVQQHCVCTCKCAGHVHQHDRVASQGAGIGFGLPLFNGALGYSGGAANYPSIYNSSSSISSSEQHSFSSSTAISTSNNNTHNHHSDIVEPLVFPFKGGHVKHTHASYRRESLAELNAQTAVVASIGNGHANGHANGSAHVDRQVAKPATPAPAQAQVTNGWTLCLPITVPLGLANATLESLVYTVRYASLDAGSASVQTDIVLSHGTKLAEGIVTDYSKLALFGHSGGSSAAGKGYGPPMLNEAHGLVLASVPAFKNAGGAGAWSHYLDHQKISPNVRIGDDSYSAHTQGQLHGSHAHHLYLFFHVYEYPGEEAMRSISVDVSATWNDGAELKRAKEEKLKELNEFKVERERLIVMKREVELTILRLEESVKRSNEEHERRMKGELVVEKELEERQREFLAVEKAAREAYESRMKAEERRLGEIEEADLKAKRLHEKRIREEEQRFKALSEAEQRAELEHKKRLQEEAEKLREINEAERHLKSEHEKRASEEQAKMRELEETQRKFKEETERITREERERHAIEEARWKVHEETEAKTKVELEAWSRAQSELIAKEERERKARIEVERVAHEEAERRVREENERRVREESERKVREEAERAAKAEAERRAKAAAAVKVVPSISEAPHVADDHMQEHIAKIAEKLGQKCKNGYAWEKKAHGYKCSGGGHFISFKDLGMQ